MIRFRPQPESTPTGPSPTFSYNSHDEGRAGDQIMCLECAIDCGFRYKVAFLIGKRHRQFSRRGLRFFQRQLHNLPSHLIRNAVPNVFGLGRLVLKSSFTALQIPIIPTEECGAGDAELGQRQSCRQMRPLDQSDDLQLLRCRYNECADGVIEQDQHHPPREALD